VTIERKRAVLEERPAPVAARRAFVRGGTIVGMDPGGTTKLVVPRWIQLVGLPLLLLAAWSIAGAVRHVVFLFIVAGLIALLLNPLVRGLGRAWIPRGFAVALVYLTFAALVVLAGIALATVVVDQTKSAANRVDDYFTVEHGQPPRTDAEHDVVRFQAWLNRHHLERVKVQKPALDFLHNAGSKDVSRYSSKAISWAEGAAISIVSLLFSTVLIIVVSIYMLLDMQRLARLIDRRFPPRPGSRPLMWRVEHALVSYVKGQLLLSLIIGVSAGLGVWLLGVIGLVPGADKYALLFGLWVAFTELIPYLGPWLGALPPFFYALAVHPVSALWIALLFLFIHQIEGHVVVPNVMGTALRLHPLLVIFGLLAGGEIYGLPGIFVALPLLAVVRAVWEFFSERVEFERWEEDEKLAVPVDVEPEVPRVVGRGQS
jgi:predicted PurR-regulated permease PerM